MGESTKRQSERALRPRPSPHILEVPYHQPPGWGLDHAEHIPSLAVLFHSRAELTLNYSTALGALADKLDRGYMQDLVDILARAKDEIASAPFN